MKNPRAWYRIEAKKADASVADIFIVDFIGDWIDDYWGFGVTAKAFLDQLSKMDDGVKTIRVHINSPGGDVFAAANIANALRDQQVSKNRTVETVVEGLAASAASVVMMAGSTIRIADNAMVMIHDPYMVAIGNAKEMRKYADELDKVRDTIVATYKWHSNLSVEEIQALMADETWMDADDAIANGFATEKIEGLKAAASIDPSALGSLKVPAKFADRVKALIKPAAAEPPAPVAASASDVLRLCREHDCLDVAESLLVANATLPDVQAKVAAEKATRAAAAERAMQIRAICKTSKMDELADGYIAGGMSVDAVRAQLTVITAKVDRVEIDGSLSEAAGRRPEPVNIRDAYKRLNQPASH